MRIQVVDAIKDYEVPLYYVVAREKLYSQRFITVDNLLTYNPDFISSGSEVVYTSGNGNPKVQMPKVEVTDEFYVEQSTGRIIPLWYTAQLKKPVKAKKVRQVSVSQTATPSMNGIVRFSNLRERETEYLVVGKTRVSVNGTNQSEGAYVISYGRGEVTIDVSSIPGMPIVALTAELVELALETTDYTGYYIALPIPSFQDHYGVVLLLSDRKPFNVKYTYRGRQLEDKLIPEPYFNETEPDLVFYGSTNFAVNNGILQLPDTRSTKLYAFRNKYPESPTTIIIESPKGQRLDSTWYMRLGGTVPVGYAIKEISSLSRTSEIVRRRTVEVIDRRRVLIDSRDLVVRIDDNGTIESIVLKRKNDNVRIPVVSYDATSGVATTSVDLIETGVEYEVEYSELMQYYEYDKVQLNPALEADPEVLLNNHIIIYAINDGNLDSNLRHSLLPRYDQNNAVIEYTYAQILSHCQSFVSPGVQVIPIAKITVMEVTNEKLYAFYDIRSPGGYRLKEQDLTDIATWDGEDIDITGKLITVVPSQLTNYLYARKLYWNKGRSEQEIRDETEAEIRKVIQLHTRDGMQNEIIVEW